jgi:uncharacterized protein
MRQRPIFTLALVVLLAGTESHAVSSTVVISQVYGGGGNSGATFTHDFIELFNRGSVPVDLGTWSVQYASSVGSTWSRTNLTGTLQPGAYYLIQQAQGAGGTTPLPAPDASGTTAMSATAGKVALVSNQVTLACSPGCISSPAVVDFIGYGGANEYEGSPGPTLSNITAAIRGGAGCTETDDNAADFIAAAPNPRNSSGPIAVCNGVAIHDVQGAGSTSPMVGVLVTVDGIVTARTANGYYLQAVQDDADPATSEGILVAGTPPASASAGNLLRIQGTVAEVTPPGGVTSVTQLGAATVVALLSTGNPLPAPAMLADPSFDPAGGLEQLERFEGMRVQIGSFRVVAPTGGAHQEANGTGSSNGIFFAVPASIARPFREPGVDVIETLPSGSPCCIPRFDHNPERLRVSTVRQTGSIPLDVATGSMVTATGVLDQEFGAHTLLTEPAPAPVVTGTFTPAAVRAAASDECTVGFLDLQRLFDSVDDPELGEPVLTATGLDLRLGKLSRGIRELGRTPDILAVASVENLAVLQDLAGRVNADAVAAGQPDPGYVAHLAEGNDITGVDVGFLVKGARVSVVDVTQEGLGATFLDPGTGQPALTNDHPPLVLRAQVLAPPAPPFALTAIAVHHRTMSGIAGDGAAAQSVRARRRAQAEYLANLIQARQAFEPPERIVVIGDLNAFEFSDGYVDVLGTVRGAPAPANAVVLASPDLVGPDFTDQTGMVPASERYSFVFDGSAQSLDHAITNSALDPWVRDRQHSRGNADAPVTWRNDPATPMRCSDHDLLVVYLQIPTNTSAPRAAAAFAAPVVIPNPLRRACELRFTLPTASAATLQVLDPSGRRLWQWRRASLPAGEHAVSWEARDQGGTPVPPGLYFLRFEAGGRVLGRRLVVLE